MKSFEKPSGFLALSSHTVSPRANLSFCTFLDLRLKTVAA